MLIKPFKLVFFNSVIPAKAGIQLCDQDFIGRTCFILKMDSRLRVNDGLGC